MPAIPTARLHEEHRQWQTESAAWRDEIDVWLAEDERALAALARVEAELRARRAGLMDLRNVIGQVEHEVERHEHELARHERDRQPIDPHIEAHRQWATKQEQLREKHAALKRAHHDALAALRKLERALGV